ncbi:MAG: VOC family protein [Bacteroidota bacterium]
MPDQTPAIKDLKIFVPTRDYELSIEFYTRLGWTLNWKSDGLAEVELAGQRMLLQKYYAKEWANNFMIYLNVESAQDWYEHVDTILKEKKYEGARVNPPKEEDYGAIVTYVWDPCGVLLHFAEEVKKES